MNAREHEFAEAVERYLEDVGGTASIGEIRRGLPFYINLTDEEKRTSATRPGEQMWEQIVRNIVCHRESEGNAVKTGTLIYNPRHLSLADSPQGDLFG